MGILLHIIATLLFLPLSLINLVVVLCLNIRTRGFFKITNGFFRSSAYDIDCFGNHNFRSVLNLFLKNKEGYEFGDKRESISSVLGKNKRDKTLSITGKVVAFILDLFDKNHCIKSIKEL